MTKFLDAWWHIVTDPAHMAAEVTLMLVVDVLFLGAIWPFVKRAVRKHDREAHPKILDCILTASCGPGDHTYSWPCEYEFTIPVTDPSSVLGPYNPKENR